MAIKFDKFKQLTKFLNEIESLSVLLQRETLNHADASTEADNDLNLPNRTTLPLHKNNPNRPTSGILSLHLVKIIEERDDLEVSLAAVRSNYRNIIEDSQLAANTKTISIPTRLKQFFTGKN